MKRIPFKLILITLGYFCSIIIFAFSIEISFTSALRTIHLNFGYGDWQHFWRSSEDFLQLKIPYKEFYYEYGILWLALQSFFYALLGRTYLALLESTFIVLPILAITTSYIVAKKILKKEFLVVIFMFMMALFGTNSTYQSLRHLIAEAGLMVFVLFLWNKRNSWLLGLSGFLVGLGVLGSAEYGIAANIAIVSLLLVLIFTKAIQGKRFFYFVAGQLVALAPFILILLINGAVANYFRFMIAFSSNFYYSTACSFPRLSHILAFRTSTKLSILGYPNEFLQNLNLYVIPGFYFIFAVLVSISLYIKKRLDTGLSVKILLILYGLLIFIRTLDTPCLNNLDYGLVPFFLLLMLFFYDLILWFRKDQRKKYLSKIGMVVLCSILLIWFIASGQIFYFFLFPPKVPPSKFSGEPMVFNNIIGYSINKELADQYQEIVDYIEKATNKNSYLYIYPWGPYNDLTGLKAPSRFTNIMQHQTAGLDFTKLEIEDLERYKPQYVVFNTFNNNGFIAYDSDSKEDSLVFSNKVGILEDYLIENYQVVFHNQVGVISRRRQWPIVHEKYLTGDSIIKSSANYDLTLNKAKFNLKENYFYVDELGASVEYKLTTPVKASGVTLGLKSTDQSELMKHLTRYVLTITVILSDGREFKSEAVASKGDRVARTDILFNNEEKISRVRIEVEKNTGFLWFNHPNALIVESIDIINKSL